MSKMGEFDVLWIYQRMSTSKSSLKIEAGQQPSLCLKGAKHMLCVAAGYPVRVVKREAQDFDKMRPVYRGGKPYPVRDAVSKFEEIAGRCGITQAARKLLDRAANERGGAEPLNEDAFENEEELTMNPNGENNVTQESNGTEQTTTAEKKAKPAAKPKAEKKAKPAAKPKAEKKAKPAAKPKAEKKAKPAGEKKGDGLGREGSLTRFVNERLVKGQDNATISAAAKKAFPDSETTDNSHISWYRWRATKNGLIKK